VNQAWDSSSVSGLGLGHQQQQGVEGNLTGGARRLSLQEKVKGEEEDARMAAVQRSRREKEAILKARKERRKKSTTQAHTQQQQAVAPTNVVLKRSELLKTDQPQPQPQPQPSSSTPAVSATNSNQPTSTTTTDPTKKIVRIPVATVPTTANSNQGATTSGSSGNHSSPKRNQQQGATTTTGALAEEESALTRDDIRNELEQKLYAFMPNCHEFRDASRGSVPERSRAAPGGLCNRHCSRNCLKSCTAGFLMAIDVPVKATSQGGKVGLDELFDTVNKGMRKFHPDRNSVRRVGLRRSLYCEEVCKDLSLLQSLMDTTNEVTFALIFGNNDLPKMRVNMSLSATVAQLKKRVVEDYEKLDSSSLTLRAGGVVMKEATTLGSCGIKENCIVEVQCSIKGWTSF
jgi:hypothetical protein